MNMKMAQSKTEVKFEVTVMRYESSSAFEMEERSMPAAVTHLTGSYLADQKMPNIDEFNEDPQN